MLQSTDHGVESASSVFGMGFRVDVRGSRIADFVRFSESDGHGEDVEEGRVTFCYSKFGTLLPALPSSRMNERNWTRI